MGTMIRQRAAQLRALLQDEGGGSQIMMLGIMLGALLLVPFFFDFASVHYSRRTAQTGTDAATMAAATEYARELSLRGQTWEGICGEQPPMVVGRYLLYIQPIQWNRNIGLPWAQQFSTANRTTLSSFQVSGSPHFKIVDGVTIPYMYVFASVRKPVNLTMQEEYGSSYRTTADATSEVFLDHWDHWTVPCTLAGEPDVMHFYIFYWKAALVDSPF